MRVHSDDGLAAGNSESVVGPVSAAADPAASRALVRQRRRRGRLLLVAKLGAACAFVLVLGSVVTGYLSVVGTGSCETGDGHEVCVRRGWWPLTIQQRSETWTRDGVADGPRVEWHPNGNVWIAGLYTNGVRTGVWREFWRSGAPRFVGTFDEGSLAGTETWFYVDGQVEWTVDRINGEREGVERWFHPNGTLRREGSYVRGLKHGPFTSYDANGRRLYTTMYANGILRSQGDPADVDGHQIQ